MAKVAGKTRHVGTQSTSRFFLLEDHYYVKMVTTARFLELRICENPSTRPRGWRER
jgi:hypothetical protein